jgi:hypothetical protein
LIDALISTSTRRAAHDTDERGPSFYAPDRRSLQEANAPAARHMLIEPPTEDTP